MSVAPCERPVEVSSFLLGSGEWTVDILDEPMRVGLHLPVHGREIIDESCRVVALPSTSPGLVPSVIPCKTPKILPQSASPSCYFYLVDMNDRNIRISGLALRPQARTTHHLSSYA